MGEIIYVIFGRDPGVFEDGKPFDGDVLERLANCKIDVTVLYFFT